MRSAGLFGTRAQQDNRRGDENDIPHHIQHFWNVTNIPEVRAVCEEELTLFEDGTDCCAGLYNARRNSTRTQRRHIKLLRRAGDNLAQNFRGRYTNHDFGLPLHLVATAPGYPGTGLLPRRVVFGLCCFGTGFFRTTLLPQCVDSVLLATGSLLLHSALLQHCGASVLLQRYAVAWWRVWMRHRQVAALVADRDDDMRLSASPGRKSGLSATSEGALQGQWLNCRPTVTAGQQHWVRVGEGEGERGGTLGDDGAYRMWGV